MEYLILLISMIGLVVCGQDKCESHCQKTFPLHTYPKNDAYTTLEYSKWGLLDQQILTQTCAGPYDQRIALPVPEDFASSSVLMGLEIQFSININSKKAPYFACLRGCRLERIDQVSRDWENDHNGAEKICEKDCKTAYSGNMILKNACTVGCKAAHSTFPTQETMLKHERLKAGFSDGQHYFILQPVMVIRRYCSGLYNVVITYMGREKTVIVTEGNTKPLSIEVVSGPGYFHIDSTTDLSFKSDEKKAPKVDVVHTKVNLSWLDCVASKAGIPKWLLGGALFLSLTAIFYLCCSSCCEAGDEKRYKFDDVLTIEADGFNKMPLYTPTDQALELPPKYSEKGGIL